jgi:hypothetical protein
MRYDLFTLVWMNQIPEKQACKAVETARIQLEAKAGK